MTKNLKEAFYSEQVPELIGHLDRIASALERQIELAEESREMQKQRIHAGQEIQSEQQAERRKKFEANLKKLAEVDRMARELRRKLEEKQAAQEVAEAVRADATEVAKSERDAGDSKEKPSDKVSVPTEN